LTVPAEYISTKSIPIRWAQNVAICPVCNDVLSGEVWEEYRIILAKHCIGKDDMNHIAMLIHYS
jgi:uncharacterized radical SAM superfamily Fe-S cluster-containing enzyme